MKVEMRHSTVDKLQSVTVCLQRALKISDPIPYGNHPCLRLIPVIKHKTHQPAFPFQAVDIDDDLIVSLPVYHWQSRLDFLHLKVCFRIPLLQYGSRRHQMIQKFYVILFVIGDLRTVKIGIRYIFVPIDVPSL